MLASLGEQMSALGSQIAGQAGGFAGPSADAEPFIASDERPPVGDRALEERGV